MTVRGASGSGKSLFLRALADLDGPPVIEPTLDGEFCARGRLWATALAGRRSEALDRGDEPVDRARRLQRRTVEAALLHDLARLGRPGGAAARLEALAAETKSGSLKNKIEALLSKLPGK